MLVDSLVDICLLLAILVGLVVLHELGHFLAARRANVKVHEFGIGFPPRALVLRRDRETTWSLNWLPIGGFVRMEGEDGESLDPRAFVNQALRTRLVILLAGVVMNFLLAWLIFSAIAFIADPVALVRVGRVHPGSPAQAAGLIGGVQVDTRVVDGREIPVYDDSGDLIVAIDGRRFPVFDHVDSARPGPLQYLYERPGQEVDVTVRRADGTELTLPATLRPADQLQLGALGIDVAAFEREDIGRGPIEALSIGLQRTVDASTLILRGVVDFFANLAEPQVAGPIGIVGVVGDVRTLLPPAFLVWFIGLLSANLAVINALPIPPLDGGRVLMSLLKAGSGGRISPATERLVYLTGFIALMAFMAWVTLSDIQRLGGE